jgi:diketogulonate reductase-like aldo/keto reductase
MISQVQTKYTSVQGQDPENMPYNPRSSVTDQVHASIQSSLRHLRPSEEIREEDPAVYIDTVVLHQPLPTTNQTLEVWKALETYVPHRIRHLGISNCGLPVLETLYRSAEVTIKPAVVQNRFYPRTGYDVSLRAFCRAHGIIYQSFWTLTANPGLLTMPGPVGSLAQQVQISTHAALYCLVLALGHTTVLDGTTDEVHMAMDLAAPQIVERFSREQREEWQQLLGNFKRQIGESE